MFCFSSVVLVVDDALMEKRSIVSVRLQFSLAKTYDKVQIDAKVALE